MIREFIIQCNLGAIGILFILFCLTLVIESIIDFFKKYWQKIIIWYNNSVKKEVVKWKRKLYI